MMKRLASVRAATTSSGRSDRGDADTVPAGVLVLDAAHQAVIARELAAARPEEGCGVLLGRRQGERSLVEGVRPAANDHPGDRTRRYRVAAEALLAAHKEGRRRGLEVVGYYHSHPGGTAVPSPADRREAWPGASYLIVVLDGDKIEEMRSWRLSGDSGDFREEGIEILGAEDS